MGPVFASPDIAALVAAFPPQYPTKNACSLVLTRSGNGLQNSWEVYSNLRTLLEESPSRIRISDLPAKLNITHIDWLLVCYDAELFLTLDKRELLRQRDLERVLDQLEISVRSSVVNGQSYSSAANISLSTLQGILDRHKERKIQQWTTNDESRGLFFYSTHFADEVRQYLQALSVDDLGRGVDLNEKFDSAPADLLLSIAKDVKSDIVDKLGEWGIVGGRAVFVPANHTANSEGQRQHAMENKADRFASDLLVSKYCVIPCTGEVEEILQSIRARVRKENNNDELEQISLLDQKATMLANVDALQDCKKELHDVVLEEIERAWLGRDGPANQSALTDTTLAAMGRRETGGELSALLLRTNYRSELEEIIARRISILENADHIAFTTVLQTQLLALLLLYSASVSVAEDETLRTHLEEYLRDHFRRDLVPTLLNRLHGRRLLLEKARKREVDKFAQACHEAKTLSEIHSSATKLARKLKIEPPSQLQLQAVRVEQIQQKGDALQKLSRGSDILQHLLWLLLAQKVKKALFISSGKDTSRMIKLYKSAGGEADVVDKLERWRDMLKAGEEDKGMLDEMRRLGREAAVKVRDDGEEHSSARA